MPTYPERHNKRRQRRQRTQHNKRRQRTRHNKRAKERAGFYTLQSQNDLAELEFDTSPFPEVPKHTPIYIPKQPSHDPKEWKSYQNGLVNYRNLKNTYSYLKSNNLTNIDLLDDYIKEYEKKLQKTADSLKQQMDKDKNIY